MEDFDVLRFELILAEQLADKNIDPRGVTLVEVERDMLHLQWVLRVRYEVRAINQAWIADQLITDEQALRIADMEAFMEHEARMLVIQIRGLLIPDRHEWFDHISSILDRIDNRRHNGF